MKHEHDNAIRKDPALEWVRANNLDADRIPEDSPLDIVYQNGQAMIRYEEYVFDADGEPVVADSDGYVRRVEKISPLITPMPEAGDGAK